MVVGIDLTPEMLAEARGLQREYGFAHTAWSLADAGGLPFPDRSFQLVACRRAAHHFTDVGMVLAEMQRVLLPGGRLVIDDRSVPEDDFVDACMNELDRYHDESHVRQYRPSEWRRMLEEAGFLVAEIEPYVKHRPLSSLTHGVSAKNVARIHRVLQGLDQGQRQAFNLKRIDGGLYLNHWYVMVAARKES
jgi:ubiquinone/menaquinone biosynthesis C-methylase UbiE